MYIMKKQLSNAILLLELKDGVYTISIQAKINEDRYCIIRDEILETYDAMDYRIEEMVIRVNDIYTLLISDKVQF